MGLQKGGATGLAPIRVLVVDDSYVIRGLLTRSLDSDPGIKVVATASNGKAAIDEVTRTELEVVVLDIEMPVMDGFVVCEKLRKDDAVKHIPIVILTATNNPKLNEKAFKAGADIVTLKVLSTERLANMIRLAIGKGKAAPPA